MTYPLSKAAVEAAAREVYAGKDYGNWDFGWERALEDQRDDCMSEAARILRAALAVWEPSEHEHSDDL